MLSILGTTAATADIRNDLINNCMRGKGLAEEQNSTLGNNFQHIHSPHSVASPFLNWMTPSQFPPGLWTMGVQAHRTADMN